MDHQSSNASADDDGEGLSDKTETSSSINTTKTPKHQNHLVNNQNHYQLVCILQLLNQVMVHHLLLWSHHQLRKHANQHQQLKVHFNSAQARAGVIQEIKFFK